MLHAKVDYLRRLFRFCTLLLALPTLGSPLAASTKAAAIEPHHQLPTMDLVHYPNKRDEASGVKAARIARALATNLTTRHPELRAQQLLSSHATRSLANQTEKWFNHWGTARVSLNTNDKKFNHFDGSIALLLPLDSLTLDPETFTQWLVQQERGETSLNIGIGQRYNFDKWLLGGNLFSDNNVTRAHSRIGVGLEAWSNFLRLSINGYIPLSKWKKSKKLNWESEKPAGGFDLRLQGYLPSYQQLGGKLLFEQYYGDEVALFGLDKLQKNPVAAGVELSYTPFPMLTLAVEHRIGNQGKNSTRCSLQLQYVLNTPWSHQIDAARVANLRDLSFSKFDFVDRNNRMVMQRKPDQLSINGPKTASGAAGTELDPPLEFTFKAVHGLKNIELSGDEISANGGKIDPAEFTVGEKEGKVTIKMTLPLVAADDYKLEVIALDQKGNRSKKAITTITSTSNSKVQLTVTPMELRLKKDRTPGILTITVKDPENENPTIEAAEESKKLFDIEKDVSGTDKSSGTEKWKITAKDDSESGKIHFISRSSAGDKSSKYITVTVQNSADIAIVQGDGSGYPEWADGGKKFPGIGLIGAKFKLKASGGDGKKYTWSSNSGIAQVLTKETTSDTETSTILLTGLGVADITVRSGDAEQIFKVTNSKAIKAYTKENSSSVTEFENMDYYTAYTRCNAEGKLPGKDELEGIIKDIWGDFEKRFSAKATMGGTKWIWAHNPSETAPVRGDNEKRHAVEMNGNSKSEVLLGNVESAGVCILE